MNKQTLRRAHFITPFFLPRPSNEDEFTADWDDDYSFFGRQMYVVNLHQIPALLEFLRGKRQNLFLLRKLTPLPAESCSISISMEYGVIGRGRGNPSSQDPSLFTCVNGPVWKTHSSEN